MDVQFAKKIYEIKKQIKMQFLLKDCKKKNIDRLKECRLADIYAISERNEELYMETMRSIYENSFQKIKHKEKIRVAFVLYSAAMWSCTELYEYLYNDERFEPYIVVAKYTNESNIQTCPTFNMSINFFKEKGHKYITVDDYIKKNEGWSAMGCPDIVFYLTPYHTLLPVGINQGYLPAKVLTVYIPYSYMLIKAEEKYTCPAFEYSWRHFCESEIYRKLLIEYNGLYEYNTFFVGYPKMDMFFKDEAIDTQKLWKGDNIQHKKKIIFAPHHSLKNLDYCSSHFSTFDKNYEFIFELAKKYKNSTSWIIKPHPNLKKTAIMAGVFKSEEEYNQYLEKWNELPNAKVVQEGTYVDYFKTSDAMICDSVSFLAEYQFTGKPLLLLTRPEQAFNKFGDLIQRILYKCDGTDHAGIEKFIREVVIDDNDEMKTERLSFFDENLNYYEKNDHVTASKKIFDEICEGCFK